MTRRITAGAAFTAILLGTTDLVQAETLTIATVNNSAMIIMQELSSQWEEQSGHTLDWAVLEEFVAGFIGLPTVNFLPAKAVRADGSGVRIVLPISETAIHVPVDSTGVQAREPLSPGVRPEHLHPRNDGTPNGEVMVAERLGGQTFLYINAGADDLLVASADGEDPTRVHDAVRIGVDPRTCHLFGRDGRALPRLERHPLADIKQLTVHHAA